jgi:hypothetical protein
VAGCVLGCGPAAPDAAHHFARPLPVDDRSAFVGLGGPVSSLALPPSAGASFCSRQASGADGLVSIGRRGGVARQGTAPIGCRGRRLLAEGRSVEGRAGRPRCRPLWPRARRGRSPQSLCEASVRDPQESTARAVHALDRVQAPIGASDLCHLIVGGFGRWVVDRGFKRLGRRPLRVDRDPVAVDACV